MRLVVLIRAHKSTNNIFIIFSFSPVDQIVLTSSADCTIKLWSITDLNCLKTLEGHEASVTRAEFLSMVSNNIIDKSIFLI